MSKKPKSSSTLSIFSMDIAASLIWRTWRSPSSDHRLGEYVADEDLWHGAKADGTEDAARLQVVDGTRACRRAFGRHILPAGIHRYGKHIVAAREPIRNLIAKRQVPAEVFGQGMPIDRRRCSRHHSVELHKQPPIPELAG